MIFPFVSNPLTKKFMKKVSFYNHFMTQSVTYLYKEKAIDTPSLAPPHDSTCSGACIVQR